MSDVVKRLREARAGLWEQAKGVADAAAEGNRSFSAEEQGTWDALNEELNRYDQRIKAALDVEQRNKDTDDAFNRLSGKPPVPGQGGPGGDGKDTAAELRSFLAGDSGRYYDVLPGGRTDFRTLSKLTAGAGANTVPTSFYDRLIAHLIETSGVMQTGPTVLNTTSGENIQVPKTTAHSSAAIVTEGAAISASDPAFGQTTLGAYKYGTLIQVSRELLTDTGVDLEGYLAMQAGRALGNAFGAHMVTGTGTAQPTGVATVATVGVTGPTGTSTSFGNQATVGQGADLLIQLFYSVIAPYRNSPSAAWLVKDSTMGTLRQIKSTAGDYLVQGGIAGPTGESILGKPVYTDPNVAAPGVSTRVRPLRRLQSVLRADRGRGPVRAVGRLRVQHRPCDVPGAAAGRRDPGRPDRCRQEVRSLGDLT
jgi:HK97 family phage major capsid protein